MNKLGIVVLLAAGLCGCGSSQSGSLRAASATMFAAQVSQTAAQGLANSVGSSPGAPRRNSISCTPSQCMIVIPVDYTAGCASGGSMSLSGTISGTVQDGTGTGLISFDDQQTTDNWNCISGYVIQGDLQVQGKFSFISGNAAVLQSVNITGNFGWGNTSQQECSLNLAVNINLTGSGTVTGTVCGEQVNTSFAFQES